MLKRTHLIKYVVLGMLVFVLVSCSSENEGKIKQDQTEMQQESIAKESPETINSGLSTNSSSSTNSDSPMNSDSSTNSSIEQLPTTTNDREENQISSESVHKIELNSSGSTLETRIATPTGYERVTAEEQSLTQFLRTFPLKEDGANIFLYDGKKKGNQRDHVAIFNLDLEPRDLQQCADSIIRVYAEYYWSLEAYDKINFHLTNGFLMEYTKWRNGNRIKVDGNNVSWYKKTGIDTSYETFRTYLTSVFAYAGTLSLEKEGIPIELEEIRVGDMFIQGGSPGHCVLVVDMAENKEGKKCVLLAQGYMPAQEFHVLKNPSYSNDPWYYVEEMKYPVKTPQWVFEEESLRRWGEFK